MVVKIEYFVSVVVVAAIRLMEEVAFGADIQLQKSDCIYFRILGNYSAADYSSTVGYLLKVASWRLFEQQAQFWGFGFLSRYWFTYYCLNSKTYPPYLDQL